MFRTNCDTEVLVHLWEEYGEGMFEHLRGQFAFALYDRNRKWVILARDRVGICPLHWVRQNEKLYFGSEIKAILASGQVEAQPDLRGLDHIFTFFAMPGRRTAFRGISAVCPGSYLRIRLGAPGELADVEERFYWDFDFPDAGEEYDPPDPRQLIDHFRETFFRAVEVRLRADIPVVGYLSGGIDSASVLAAAGQMRGSSIPSFTIKIDSPRYDEEAKARGIARRLGSEQTVVRCDGPALSQTFPDLVLAADCPVVDTACAALHNLAAEVRRQGYKVALTGEGADEALGGYPWFKVNKLLGLLDIGGIRLSNLARRAALAVAAPMTRFGELERCQQLVGGPLAQVDIYSLMLANRRRLFSAETRDSLGDFLAFEDLVLDRKRMRRWHPLNQSLYLGYKTILPGLLLSHKGDRVAMASSVETRYPFLDEEVIALCARIAPRWKLRGILRDKVVLRCMAEDMLPPEITRCPKAMFRAPFGETFFGNPPPFVGELLSEKSLQRTGYFETQRVQSVVKDHQRLLALPGRRLFEEMGLTAVVATQLWHHLFLGGGLCSLPTWEPPAIDARSVQQAQIQEPQASPNVVR